MRRRAVIALLGATAAWPLAARAQQPMPVIGFLHSGTSQQNANRLAGFRKGLGEAGFVENQNVAIEYRWADGQAARLPDLAADLIRRQVSVITALSSQPATLVAKAATTSIPIVFTWPGDPVKDGLVSSLNRPGGNVTGQSSQASEIGPKRLQIMDELVPGKRTIAALLNPDAPFSVLALQELRAAAEPQRLRIDVFEARTADQVSTSIEAASKAGAAGLITLEDPLLLGLRRQIADLAARIRLPAVYGNRDFVEAGGLMSYGVDRRQQSRRAADYVDRILKGAKPADLPVEQPTIFELVINLKTAQALGLDIPDRLLALANEVIE